MSINPPVTDSSQPILFPGELFLTSASETSFQVESGGGYPGDSISFYGKGNAYLTDLRLILVTQPLQPTGFQGLQLPLIQIRGERLQCPFVGRKTIVGQVDLAVGAGLFEQGEFKVAFTHRGAEDLYLKLTTALEQSYVTPVMNIEVGSSLAQTLFEAILVDHTEYEAILEDTFGDGTNFKEHSEPEPIQTGVHAAIGAGAALLMESSQVMETCEGLLEKQGEERPRVAFINPENGLEAFVACDPTTK